MTAPVVADRDLEQLSPAARQRAQMALGGGTPVTVYRVLVSQPRPVWPAEVLRRMAIGLPTSGLLVAESPHPDHEPIETTDPDEAHRIMDRLRYGWPELRVRIVAAIEVRP
ncbi:hypothetical protein AB0B94_30355 [Micromonospora sp. NPDC048986]|uniref:hypothetical protein n=1 Tax=Micromonospora sp. NPDC048986 TaxID=3155644 RepID=UPI0033D4262B